jgi:hypothetical protein
LPGIPNFDGAALAGTIPRAVVAGLFYDPLPKTGRRIPRASGGERAPSAGPTGYRDTMNLSYARLRVSVAFSKSSK